MHDNSFAADRFKVTVLAAGTALAGVFRTMSRLLKTVIEVAKVIFYVLVCLCTLGFFGNGNRLLAHCKLLLLNAAAIAAQPLQVAIHSLATLIGIVSPMAAYRTLQIGTTPIAWITSHENAIWERYKAPKFYRNMCESIASMVSCIFNKCPYMMQAVMKTFVNEFSEAFDSALVAPLGYMDQFHSFGANPKTLTLEQKKMVPLLLLNGNYSQQATFLPLLYALEKAGSQRPVYTINLPSDTTDPSFIAPKIAEIKKQYGIEPFEIDLIGHSMGSNLIQNIRPAPDEYQIRRAITIGTPFMSKTAASIAKEAFDIIAAQDCLVKHKSLLAKSQQKEFKTGHLGLLTHPKSVQLMVQLLA